MSVKYSKWPFNISTFSNPRPSKIYPFWFEKKASGNPWSKEAFQLVRKR
jgi:hypothetical protein